MGKKHMNCPSKTQRGLGTIEEGTHAFPTWFAGGQSVWQSSNSMTDDLSMKYPSCLPINPHQLPKFKSKQFTL